MTHKLTWSGLCVITLAQLTKRSTYVVQQFVSLEGVKLQVAWFPIQHQGFAARVHNQVCPDTFSCTGKQKQNKKTCHMNKERFDARDKEAQLLRNI